MAKTGRPSDYTEELVSAFLDLISEGYSVVQICDRDDMPSKATIFKWLCEKEGFSDKYYSAKELSGDADADFVQELAHKAMNGQIDANAARAAMTGFMWSAARKKPKKYGDKIQHSGDSDNPIEHRVEYVIVDADTGS